MTPIATYPENTAGRDFAVGDIHGCFSALQKGLDSIRFDPSVDRLFAMGDLVDRGSESHLVLQWLDMPWFHSVVGNHEFMTWRSVQGSPYLGIQHLDSGGIWYSTLALPIAIEVATPEGVVGLVHGDCPFDDWAQMRTTPWAQLHDEHDLVDCCLWSYERYKRQYKGRVRNIRAVVHGHTTLAKMDVLGNVYFIDTGGWLPGARGHFTFLDLHTLKPATKKAVKKCV